MTELRADNAYLELQLETSRSRERKQQMEYDAVAEALPLAQAELEELQPQADAAKETENALRAQRKQLRSDVASLEAAVQTLTETDAQITEIVEALRPVGTLLSPHEEETNP